MKGDVRVLCAGVVTPTGHRYVLGIPEGANATIETGRRRGLGCAVTCVCRLRVIYADVCT